MRKTKILAITSDPALLRFLQQGLSNGDYEIVSTQHTNNALKDVLDKEVPDFIIQDIMMPSLDGIEVCLQLRQWTQCPIMMLSTWGTGDGKVRGLDLGSNSYLAKPFAIDELNTRVEEILQRNSDAATRQLIKTRSSIS